MSEIPSEPLDLLLRQVIAEDSEAIAEAVRRAPTSQEPSLLVTVAILQSDRGLLCRAESYARNVRDRLLVALAVSWLSGDSDRLDLYARDILADHPDHLLAAWIAGRPHPHVPGTPTQEEF